MKKRIKQFDQYLSHDIEDEDAARKYLDDSLPLVGEVVMYFNGLEKQLDSLLCEVFSDRSDAMGLIVLHRMTYAAKVDLFKRLADAFHAAVCKVVVGYDTLIEELKQVGILRNQVIHADWDNTDEQGYTSVKLRISQGKMEQEYVQFSAESLDELIRRIWATSEKLEEYWEKRSEILHG